MQKTVAWENLSTEPKIKLDISYENSKNNRRVYFWSFVSFLSASVV